MEPAMPVVSGAQGLDGSNTTGAVLFPVKGIRKETTHSGGFPYSDTTPHAVSVSSWCLGLLLVRE